MKITAAVIFLVSGIFLAGCIENLEESEKKILASDPSFSKTIDERNAIQNQIDSMRAAYDAKCRKIDDEISTFKEERSVLKIEHIKSVEAARRQINPQKRTMQQDLMELRHKLKLKVVELGSITKDINEIDSLVKKKDRLELTREEAEAWNKRLTALIERKGGIQKEVDKLKEDINITDLKIRVLEVK